MVELIDIEVAYAEPERQALLAVQVPVQSTLAQAIAASGILQLFPQLDLSQHKTGLFSQLCGLDTIVNAGDRVEIYRPLAQDPMAARRSRLRK